MSKKLFANNTITMSNTTDVSVSTSFTINNNFTMTGSLNAQNSSVYLPASSNIFFESTTLSSLISSSGIPAKTIAIWNSTTLPSGWVICDGTNNTPNLLGRFVICAGSTYPVGTNGGSATAALSVSTMPAHTHGTFNTDNFSHKHDFNTRYNTSTGGGTETPKGLGNTSGATTNVNTTSAGGSHSHPAGITDSSGSSTPFGIMPPYYVMIYIMKL